MGDMDFASFLLGCGMGALGVGILYRLVWEGHFRTAILVWSVVMILCLALCASAAEPHAFMSGPASAAVGDDFFLRFKGTISDSPVVFKQTKGPSASDVMLLTAPGGQVACAVVNASKAGDYSFALLARGRVDPKSDELLDFAVLTVQVGGSPTPPPNPPVPPAPGPGVALGMAYAKALAVNNASAWEAYAAALDSGANVSDSDKAYMSTWYSLRKAWVEANLTAPFSAIMTIGKEPDAAQRLALSALAKDIAKGERAR